MLSPVKYIFNDFNQVIEMQNVYSAIFNGDIIPILLIEHQLDTELNLKNCFSTIFYENNVEY